MSLFVLNIGAGMTNTSMPKKIVLLGVDPPLRAVYEKELDGHRVHFVETSKDALWGARNASVVVVNVDEYLDVINQMITRGYDGGVVAIASSRRKLNSLFHLSNGKKVNPVCFRAAPQEIIRTLALQA